jgi:pimeloyl-ACP methyl ester carboxylesterase
VPIDHSTSLAARLQTLDTGGTIVVSEETRNLTRGYFGFKGLGSARIKGVSDPVEIHELAGVGSLRTKLEVSAKRGLVKFVGRDGEMTELAKALGRLRPDLSAKLQPVVLFNSRSPSPASEMETTIMWIGGTTAELSQRSFADAGDKYLSVAYADKQREFFPQRRTTRAPSLGHWLFIDDPDPVSRIVLPFLRAQQSKQIN